MEKILSLLENTIYCYDSNKEPSNKSCQQCQLRLKKAIEKPFLLNQPIHFVLPAFPAKSANRNKTISQDPDMGETLALHRLNQLIERINTEYQYGAKITICSDGHVFNDLVYVNDDSVDSYQEKLKTLCQKHHFSHIDFYDLKEHYASISLSDRRTQLIKEFSDPIEKIHEDIKTNKDELQLFNGLHRFLFEDSKYFHQDESNTKVKKLSKKTTYQVIQRSHAWSNLIKKTFPDMIRLSIHPHQCSSDKMTVKLFEQPNNWATPWHNVVLKTKQTIRLMKRAQAIQLGGKLQHDPIYGAYYAT